MMTVKCHPVLHHCVVVFSGPLSWVVGCLRLKVEFLSCARDVRGVTSLITIDEQLQQNRGCFSLVQAMLHEYFSFFSDYFR